MKEHLQRRCFLPLPLNTPHDLLVPAETINRFIAEESLGLSRGDLLKRFTGSGAPRHVARRLARRIAKAKTVDDIVAILEVDG